MLRLHGSTPAFSSYSEQSVGFSSRGLLIASASLVSETGSGGAQAQQLWCKGLVTP